MELDPATLPDDIAALKALLVTSHARAAAAETQVQTLDGQIAHLKLMIAKMRRDTFGTSSEKSARLQDQLELQLEELITTVSNHTDTCCDRGGRKACAAVLAVAPAA